jgi:putative spermidine/putrescine transport system substrate-binding protein
MQTSKKGILSVLLVAAALSSAYAQAIESKKTLGNGEGALEIVAWPGYIERGESDQNYDWVSSFERDTGCKVTVKTANSSDEMINLMILGTPDLVTASGDASLRLIFGGRVQPLNLELISNWQNVDPRLQQGKWFNIANKTYGVPYQWGPNVMLYNTEVFPTAPKSMGVLFEEQTLPDGKSNKGRLQAYDRPIYIADAALYLKSARPELGIDDPYLLNEEQYSAVLALLRQQRSLQPQYWHDATAQIDSFKKHKIAAGSSWPYQVNVLLSEQQAVASTVPSEGATGWADTTMLHARAPHPNCAYKWLNWSLEPKVQGDVAAWFGSVPVAHAACESNELLGKEGCTRNGYDLFDRLSFWKTPQSDFGKYVSYRRWIRDYDNIVNNQ